MYVADDRFRRNYDDRAPGLAQYVHDAIMSETAPRPLTSHSAPIKEARGIMV